MNEKQLIQFTTVAQIGSLSEASRRLHIAQPALSQSIKTLEDELSVRLFHRQRGKRSVELTDAGHKFLEYAQSILHQMNIAKELVRDTEENPTGTVAIAVPASVAHVLTQPVVSHITHLYPGISLKFEESLTGNLGRWLRTGRIELIIDFDIKDASELLYEPLIEEELYLFGTDIDKISDIPADELVNFKIYCPSEEHSMSQAIKRFEQQTGIEIPKQSVNIAVHPMLSLVTGGYGYAIAPWSLIYDLVAEGKVKARRVTRPKLKRTAYLVSHRTRPLTVAARVVQQAVRQGVKEMHAQDKWRGKVLIEKHV